jgi:DNA-binding PadR family transcriptional regulator
MHYQDIEFLALAILEEAGEEHLTSLVNSISRLRDWTDDLDSIAGVLRRLVDNGIITLAESRDSRTMKWISLSHTDAASLLQSLGDLLEWAQAREHWTTRPKAPRLEVLITDSGMQLARHMLRIRGYPLGL